MKARIHSHPTGLRATLAVILLLVGLGLTGDAQARQDESGFRAFVDAIGESLYFLAWPSAKYDSVGFGGVRFVEGGADVAVRLHGRSGFSDTHLWTDVIIEIRDGEVQDVRWGNNNAILVQPGKTMEAMGEVFAEMNAEYQKNLRQSGAAVGKGGTPSSGNGFPFYVTNRCEHPVRLAIHFKDSSGRWRTEGWWTFGPGKAGRLNDARGRNLRTKNSIWYFYGEAADGTGVVWKGDARFTWNGRNLPMDKLEDTQGDLDLTLTCP